MLLSRLLSIALAFTALSHTAWAEQIILKSTSSSVELIGEYKGFKDGVYTIETDLGELEVDARTVTCTGDDCPQIDSLVSEFAIAGDQELLNQLLIPLLESYSFSLDATLNTKITSDTKSTIKITAKDGQEFANITVFSGATTDTKNTLVIKSGAGKALLVGSEKVKTIPLAADALIAISSDTNAVKSISTGALRNVLSGSINNWKDLGGPDAAINIYLPQTSSGLVKTAKAMGYDISKLQAAERFDDLATLSKVTANDPYGLGFTSLSNRRAAHALSLVGSCGASVRPSAFAIASSSYPISFYHYLEVDTEGLPIFAREFLNYLTSTQAKSMMTRQGYSSLSVFENGLEHQGNRIVHSLLTTTKSVPSSEFIAMLRNLNNARQLSTVLRFNEDGKTLDPQSKAAFDTLISELYLGGFADQKIMIIGFTGAAGSTSKNKRKSKATAETIADLVKTADSGGLLADLQIETLGYGEASPLACEDSAHGIATNNRVEIWVKSVF